MRLIHALLAGSMLLPVGCSTVDSQPTAHMSQAMAATRRPVLEQQWNTEGCTVRREFNHSLIFAENALDVLEQGDVLYVFTSDGICAGKSEPFAGKNFAVAAWGDDGMTPEKDGLATGEPFVLVLSASNGSSPVVLHTTKVQGPTAYAANGITIIRGLEAK